MRLTKMSACLSAIMLGFTASLAYASALTIVNNTDHDSTTVTNDRICSATLPGGGGVTKAHSTNVVSEGKIKIACFHNKENCKAAVYMTNNCTGSSIATVIFDINKGIKSITMHEPGYEIHAAGFTVIMDTITT